LNQLDQLKLMLASLKPMIEQYGIEVRIEKIKIKDEIWDAILLRERTTESRDRTRNG